MDECKRSTLYMRRVAEGSMLGIFLFKPSTDERDSDFQRSQSMEVNDYLRTQENYWANRMVWC